MRCEEGMTRRCGKDSLVEKTQDRMLQRRALGREHLHTTLEKRRHIL